MRHLTPSDYRRMPWANGRGTTVELLREEGPQGLLLRLSMASVVEDGPFSLFPAIERNLTVISGPGFRLEGAGFSLPCTPLVPVAFPGDMQVQAVGTGGVASEDFNVMTARALPRPEVSVEGSDTALAAGGRLYIFALGEGNVAGRAMRRHELIVTEGPVRIDGPGSVIAVRVFR